MEEKVDFTVSKDVYFVVVLVLLEDLITCLIDFTLDIEDEFFVGLNAEVTEIINI